MKSYTKVGVGIMVLLFSCVGFTNAAEVKLTDFFRTLSKSEIQSFRDLRKEHTDTMGELSQDFSEDISSGTGFVQGKDAILGEMEQYYSQVRGQYVDSQKVREYDSYVASLETNKKTVLDTRISKFYVQQNIKTARNEVKEVNQRTHSGVSLNWDNFHDIYSTAYSYFRDLTPTELAEFRQIGSSHTGSMEVLQANYNTALRTGENIVYTRDALLLEDGNYLSAIRKFVQESKLSEYDRFVIHFKETRRDNLELRKESSQAKDVKVESAISDSKKSIESLLSGKSIEQQKLLLQKLKEALNKRLLKIEDTTSYGYKVVKGILDVVNQKLSAL